MSYYAGISSDPPKLIYRTGEKTKPEDYKLKKLCGVFGHKINDVWNMLGHEVSDLLDGNKVLWTSIDVVRFCMEDITGPVVLWIGVLPDTLVRKDAINSAKGLLKLLKVHDITDVDVEYRESVYRRSVGPPLESMPSMSDPNADVIAPLTAALGLPIAGSDTPNYQGTMGFYLAKGGKSNDILAITARHVLFPLDEVNADYAHTNNSMRKKGVLLMGTSSSENFHESIDVKIEDHDELIALYKLQIKGSKEKSLRAVAIDKDRLAEKKQELDQAMDQAIAARDDLYKLRKKTMIWSDPEQRIIGHIIRSPAITVDTGPYGFTKDYAVVQLDKERFKGSFMGNVLDLGTEIPAYEFTKMMYPQISAQSGFKYPKNRLLPLRDIVSDDLMRSPDMVDCSGEPCLFVIKNGLATGVTIGRATGIYSHVREYFPNNTYQSSKEWTILTYDNHSGVFSALGDSGSIIVDGRGRYGGLLTGGSGMTSSSDITYATPIWWLLEVIKKNGFPKAHLNPTI